MAVVVAELWETVKQAIVAYTGLSPAAFFTVVAVLLALYYAVSGFFEPPPAPVRKRDADGLEQGEPLPPPVELGEVTEEELRQYDGSDPKKPLLMAIKGQIYDVTQSRVFYGPGGPYALFAGKDASRALAKMSFEPKDLNGDITGLGPFELDALQDWEYRFMSKYVKVGTVKKTVPVTEESAGDSSQTTETAARVADVSSADSQVGGHAVGSENSPSEHGEHNPEPKDNPVGHGDAAEHRPEVEDGPVTFSGESKEVGEGEGTKEF